MWKSAVLALDDAYEIATSLLIALARRAFMLGTIERPRRLMRTGTACIARRRGLFGTLLRLVSVFLAIRTLLARALVLGMIRLTRIAESALPRIMTGCTALGTDAVRTRERVSVVSRRAAYRAILGALLIECYVRVRTTVITNHTGSFFPFDSILSWVQRPLQPPLIGLPAVF